MRMLPFCLVASSVLLCSKPSQSQKAATFPSYTRITASQLQRDIPRNKGSALELIRLMARASNNELGDVGFNILWNLKNANPHNPQVLTAFCYSSDCFDYVFTRGFRPGRPTNPPFDEKKERQIKQEANEALATAKQLAPTFWFVKQLEGGRLTSDAYSQRKREKWGPGLDLLKEATQLKPQLAITWSRYGGALKYAAYDKYVWNGRLVTPKDAVAAYEKSVRVDPMRGAWLDLFHVYHFTLKDRKNALRCKREFLKRWPKGYYLDPTYYAWFAKYPA